MSHATIECMGCSFVGCDCHEWEFNIKDDMIFCSELCREEYRNELRCSA